MEIIVKSLSLGLSVVFVLIQTQACFGASDYYRDRVEPFLKELKANYKPQIVDGVLEPKEFPDLEEDKKSLEGIDSNHDGVRDDIEIFINRNFNTWVERDNLKNEFRRAPGFYSNYKKMSIDEFIKYSSNTSEDNTCILSGLKLLDLKGSPDLVKYISGNALYNTKRRRAAFNYLSQKLGGYAYGDGFGDKKIMENCQKKITNILAKKKEKNK